MMRMGLFSCRSGRHQGPSANHAHLHLPATPTSTACVYPPLKSASSTRIFTLYPGAHSDPLAGSVAEVDLESEHASYEAISYTWGAAGNEKPITIDERLSTVWQNLADCLLNLRDPLVSKTFWIDAICIDQHNPIEKAQQVAMIAMIFARAEQVLAWLGAHADGSELLFRHFRSEIGAREAGEDDALFRAWRSLMQRPYWSRLWIVQELVKAEHVIVCCGRSRSDWPYFISNGYCWRDFRGGYTGFDPRSPIDRSETLIRAYSLIGEVVKMRGDHHPRSHYSTSLPTLMKRFIHQQCTDPLDKVYALLSLSKVVEGSHVPQLRPDYTIDVFELAARLLARESSQWQPELSWQQRGTDILFFRKSCSVSHGMFNGLNLSAPEQPKFRALLYAKAERSCVRDMGQDWPNTRSDTGETPSDFWRQLAIMHDRNIWATSLAGGRAAQADKQSRAA